MTTLDTRQAGLVLERQRDGIQRSPVAFQKTVQGILFSVAPSIKQDAHTSPRQSGLPFIWSLDPRKQAKARAYWFATHVPRGSKGGRYQRTGGLDSGTQVVSKLKATSGTSTLENIKKGAWFVFGQGQVPSHQRSNHPLFSDVAEKWRPVLENRVIDAWLDERTREASR